MRFFEITFLVILALSVPGLLFLKNKKHKMVLPLLGLAIFIICMLAEGYRYIMAPAYITGALVLIVSLYSYFSVSTKKHPALKGVGVAFFIIAYIASVMLTTYLPVVNLPAPSGPYLVGTIKMDFIHPSRKNIVSGEYGEQKIVVQAWYPAADKGKGKKARWIESRKAVSLFSGRLGLPDIFDNLYQAKTNSYPDAPIVEEGRTFPVILFSDGMGFFVGQNTMQMEELASRGYAVFSVSHPDDDFAVIYADGELTAYSAEKSGVISDDSSAALEIAKSREADEKSAGFMRIFIKESSLTQENLRIWSGDMSFAADQLEKLNNGTIQSMFRNKLNLSAIGIFGHSYGGAAAGETCLLDDRFKAFINLDGTPFGDTVDTVIEKPFMVISSAPDLSLPITPGDCYAEEQTGHRTVSIDGAYHMNFTDLNVLISKAGKTFSALGPINAARQTEIVNAYIVSFFNKHLRDLDEPLLNGTTSLYPEVRVIEY